MLIAIEHEGKGLFNGIMGAAAKHPFMKMLIDETVKNISMEFYGESPLDITGPRMCRRVFNIYEGKNISELLIADNPKYKYIEVVANEIVKDYEKNNIAFHKIFSTYYNKFNKLGDPNRYWNAWERRDVYNT